MLIDETTLMGFHTLVKFWDIEIYTNILIFFLSLMNLYNIFLNLYNFFFSNFKSYTNFFLKHKKCNT